MQRKRMLITLMIVLVCSGITLLSAEPLFRINHSSRHYTEIEFNLNDYELITNNIDGKTYHRVYHPEAALIMEEGLPELPVFTATIAVPNRGRISLQEITVLESDRLTGIDIFPSQGLDIVICEERGFLKDTSFYIRNADYPSGVAEISPPAIVRDFRFVTVALTPFRANPSQSELTVDSRVRVRLEYDETALGENELTVPRRKLSRSFETIYRSMFLNYDDIRDPSWEYQERSILVIHHSSTIIQPLVNQFVNWKRDKGFEITAVNTQNMTTNTAIKSYIQNAYDNWEHPPEYIVLMGGGSGSISIPNWPSPSPGDHNYGLLEGNDDIPDAFVGRLPVADSNQLATVWNKISNYERTPFMGNTDWYRHTLLVGDTTTSSGISPKFVMGYVKELMLIHNEDYQFTEHYSGSASTIINNAFNQGISFFPFRGYIGFAGWSPNASLLNNGLMMPNGLFITCGTLNFNNSSRAEAIVNMGTPVVPKGAVSAIGMTTGSTRTTPNNAIVGSSFYGIFNEGIRTMGETLAYAKIFLHTTYGIVHPNLPAQHTAKASLMGDPSMDIWVDVPKVMNVAYDDELPKGSNYIDFQVTDEDNQPLKDAWVTIRQVLANEEVIFVTGYTNANGEITHIFDAGNSGEVNVTVTKPDYLPHLGSFDLTGEWSVTVEDVILVNPFEAGTEASFLLTVKNYRDEAVSGIEGTITTNNPFVEIIEGTTSFGNIAPDATAEGNEHFTVAISQAAPDFMPVFFTLTLTDNTGNSWTSKFSDRINGSNLQPTAFLVGANNNSYLEPGETASLRVTLENNGQIDLQEVYGTLRSSNPLLDISDSLAYFGDIDAGQSVTSAAGNSFIVTGLDDLITGMNITVDLYLYNNFGFEILKTTTLPIGLITVTDPFGPCDYGYYIYGMEDVDYEHAPEYDWIEIAPQLGGPGVNTGLTSDWNNNQSVMTMDLPFIFTFYGVEYDEISICANGWISFGETDQATFRNYILPGPLGPNPKVAAFWDNLSLSGGGVYTYHHEDMDAFIIQWHNATIPGNHQNTFQIILYNPELEPTIDDGFIKIQYKTFNNLNSGTLYGDWSNFCTIGIGDHSGDLGLTYTFANQYPTAAGTITNESAIMIVGPMNYSEPFLLRGDILVFDENGNGIIEAGENVKLGIYIKNIGYATAENVTGTLVQSSPYISVVNDESVYEDIHTGDEIPNNQFFEFNVSSATPPGQVISFSININADNAQASFPFHLTIHRPTLQLTSYLIEEVTGNGDGIIDPGETVNLVLNFTNPSLSAIENMNLTVTSLSDYIAIDNGTFNIGDVPPESNLQQRVTITVDDDCPPGEIAGIDISVSGSNISAFSRELLFGVAVQDIFLDFEDNDGGFVSNDPDGWQWGEPAIGAFSGNNAWATVLDDNYADGANWKLESDDFLITPASLLTFQHRYNIEHYWDGGNVKISTDDGTSWQIIHPTEGYPVNNTNSGCQGIPNEPAFSGNSNGWQEVHFDLSGHFGKLARFRWHFGSGPWVNDLGWYIDDFSLSGTNPLYSAVSGSIELLQSPLAVNNVVITAIPQSRDDRDRSLAGYSVKPDLNGNYRLILPAGNYLVSAALPYHFDETVIEVTVDELDEVSDIDFTLQYLTPAENLRYTLQEDNVTVDLTWFYEPLPDNTVRGRRNNGREDDYYFAIYRQQNSGHFNLLHTTTELYHTDSLPVAEHVYRYYVVVEYPEGSSAKSNKVATDSDEFDIEEEIDLPQFDYALRQNYPNPFNPVTNISFSIPQQERVTLKIYNIKGELVRTIVDDILPAGNHSAQWYGVNERNRKVSSGVYFYRIEAGSYSEVRKALLLK